MDASETTIYHAVVISCIVIGTILLHFFVINFRLHHKILLFQKKRILQEITGLEKERSRIAADFHDELGPLLSAIKMKVSSFDLNDPDDLESQVKTIGHVDDVINRARQISFNLMPASLLKEGLINSIRKYIRFLNDMHNIKFTFHHEADFKISNEKIVSIYRVLQELIHNAIQHSGASEISLSVKNMPDKILFSVTDNGCGFDYKKIIRENKGIGLNSVRNRIKIAGGNIFLASTKDNGSHYKFEIPI